jgi:predicted transcriptional regulator
MENVKEKILEVIKAQPDDASYDEIIKELAFERMVQRGIEDFDNGKLISHDELRMKVQSWQK